MAGKKGVINRASLLANGRFEKLGLDPLDMLLEAIAFNKDQAISRCDPDFASAWLRGCVELMKYKYPVLSAVAIQDVTPREDKSTMTSQQAIEALKKDPFLSDPKTPVVDIHNALLPKGKQND